MLADGERRPSTHEEKQKGRTAQKVRGNFKAFAGLLECGKLAEDMKNIFILLESGESVLIYAGEDLSAEECAKFAERIAGEVVEAFGIKPEEVEHYNIDGRVWADTPEKVAKLREIISK